MKILLASIVCACAALAGCAELQHIGAGLELQPPKPRPIAFDLAAMSIACLSKGLLLTIIVTEGRVITGAMCEEPPQLEPGRPI